MPDGHPTKPVLNCLWLARAIPYPLTAGDRIYSFKLAVALADAGANVVFAGLQSEVPPTQAAGVAWHTVPGKERHRVFALLSVLPLVAARHATSTYRKQAATLVQSRHWDAIIIDHYGSGWLHKIVSLATDRPIIVFIAHNHEASVTKSQWRDKARSLINRAYLWQNWLKTSRLENYVARNSDLIAAITDADAAQFSRQLPDAHVLQLTPGYDGRRLEHRTITAHTPRSLVLFGSYRWSAKRASLSLFLDQADAIMARAGISIDVVGDMDDTLRRSLSAKYHSARFHGFVEDPTPYLAGARLAVLAEPVGGGFKLKLLEYIFNRVPIAALSACAHGLPETVRANLLLADDIPSLLSKVLVEINNIDVLNACHDGAYTAANQLFDWRLRGQQLLRTIQDIQSARDSVLR